MTDSETRTIAVVASYSSVVLATTIVIVEAAHTLDWAPGTIIAAAVAGVSAIVAAVLGFALPQRAKRTEEREARDRATRSATRILRDDMRETQRVLVDALREGRWPRHLDRASHLVHRDDLLRVIEQINDYKTWARIGVAHRTQRRVDEWARSRRRLDKKEALSAFRRIERGRKLLADLANDAFEPERSWRDIYDRAASDAQSRDIVEPR